jgi:glutamate formiminotransferase
VYYYEAAAARPDRANLDDVRTGQFEGLLDAVRKEASRRPDVGGPGLHPTAGACAVGARKFLISYYVSFDSSDVAMVRSIARELRPASSGLKGVKAIPLLAHGQVQLSVSITDYMQTPVSQVYRKICALAERFKSVPVHGEVVGLIPEAACERDSDWMRLLIEFDPDTKVLERRLNTPLTWPGVS